MPDIPARPPGHVLDPALYGLARAEWPGQPVTTTMLHDVAFMRGRSPFVAGTPESMAALKREQEREQQRRDAATTVRRDYGRLGFDPTRDYRKET